MVSEKGLHGCYGALHRMVVEHHAINIVGNPKRIEQPVSGRHPMPLGLQYELERAEQVFAGCNDKDMGHVLAEKGSLPTFGPGRRPMTCFRSSGDRGGIDTGVHNHSDQFG